MKLPPKFGDLEVKKPPRAGVKPAPTTESETPCVGAGFTPALMERVLLPYISSEPLKVGSGHSFLFDQTGRLGGQRLGSLETQGMKNIERKFSFSIETCLGLCQEGGANLPLTRDERTPPIMSRRRQAKSTSPVPLLQSPCHPNNFRVLI